MPLTKMEHYLVLSDDIEATRAFYCDLLGMREGFRPPMDFPGFWLYLDETPCIHVADWDSYRGHADAAGLRVSERAAGTGPLDHIAFNGTRYDELTARLDARGVEYETNLVAGIGLRQVFLHDPSGIRIELNFPPEPV